MESLEEVKAIIENAPDGAEAYCSNGQYWKFENNECFVFEQHPADMNWFKEDLMFVKSVRSLSDIKRIIELIECLQSVKQTTEDGDVLGCWDVMKINEVLK